MQTARFSTGEIFFSLQSSLELRVPQKSWVKEPSAQRTTLWQKQSTPCLVTPTHSQVSVTENTGKCCQTLVFLFPWQWCQPRCKSLSDAPALPCCALGKRKVSFPVADWWLNMSQSTAVDSPHSSPRHASCSYKGVSELRWRDASVFSFWEHYKGLLPGCC